MNFRTSLSNQWGVVRFEMGNLMDSVESLMIKEISWKVLLIKTVSQIAIVVKLCQMGANSWAGGNQAFKTVKVNG